MQDVQTKCKVKTTYRDKITCLTYPEFSGYISKSCFVFSPIAVEIQTAILTSLNDLKYYNAKYMINAFTKKAILRKLLWPVTYNLLDGIRFHFTFATLGIPATLSLTALIGMVTLTFDLLTSKQVHELL